MAQQTKSELLDELAGHVTKDELVDLIGRKLSKDELSSVLDHEGDATKEQLVHRLASRSKADLVEALGAHSTREELQRAVASHASDGPERSEGGGRRERDDDEQRPRRRPEAQRDDSTDLDWSAELDWAPPPRPTPAPVQFVGAAPYMPGQRVRVDVSGLPMLGVFAGKGASAAGTIVGVDARARMVRVYLDASFDGQKELVLPPERIVPDR